MADNRERTDRGFRIFGKTDTVMVLESSLAFEGPHCRIYGGHGVDDNHVHLSLADARAVRDALTVFIDEAERGELTERPDGR